MNRIKSAIFALTLATLAGMSLAADIPPSPGGDGYLKFKLPFGEQPLVTDMNYPTSRVWRFRNTGDLGVYTTANSVGPENALLFHLPKSGKPSEVLIFDVGVHDSDKEKTFSDNTGISFWLKGDGGDGEISIGCNWNQDVKTNPLLGKFPLADKNWKKIFVPWDKFARPVKKGFYYINVKLEPSTDRECHAAITRLAVYKQEQTEEIAPPKLEDTPGMIPAEKFVTPAPTEAQKLFPKTMEKLKAKKPVTIIATGDSITAGAQLWYMNPESKPRNSDASIYWALLEKNLAKHYGYEKERFVFKMWLPANKKAVPPTPERFEIVTGQKPEADGTLPFDGLQVIGVGAGGKDTRFALANINDVLQFKPDLVIWAYGANDATNNNIKSYREGTPAAIEKLKAQGIEVILASTTPWLNRPYFNNSAGFRDIAAELANKHDLPLVDQFAGFVARGDRYKGDLYSDQIHPNEYGHQLMASTLSAALGVPNQFIWDRPLFKSNVLKELAR